MSATREDWMRRLGPLYGGAVALVHSTPWRWPHEIQDDQARSPAWIVVLGIPVGLFAWFIAWLLRLAGIPFQLAAIVGMGALVLASAAIVERGVAERIEFWLGGPAGTRRSLATQPGVQAIVALLFITLLRTTAIFLTPPEKWIGVFVTTAVVGRWAAVFLQSLGDPVVPEEGRSLVATPAPMWLTGAISAVVIALTIFAVGKAGIIALVVTALAVFGLGLASQKRDGGLSAAVVGMAAAFGEVAILIVATVK